MSEAIFFRLLETTDKPAMLASEIARQRNLQSSSNRYAIDPAKFAAIPETAFPYWATDEAIALFRSLPPLQEGRRWARIGPSTGDNFRYFRLSWEIPPSHVGRGVRWVPFNKGGAFSTYYFDVHLLCDWDNERNTFRGFYGRPGRPTARPNGLDDFFKPGISWPLRSQRSFSARAVAAGGIFGHKGPTAFTDSLSERWALLGLMNSKTFRYLVEFRMAFGSYEVGVIQRTPVPDLTGPLAMRLGVVSAASVDLKRELDRAEETSHIFTVPAAVGAGPLQLRIGLMAWDDEQRVKAAALDGYRVQADALALSLYGLSESEVVAAPEPTMAEEGKPPAEDDDEPEEPVNTGASGTERPFAADLISWAVGCVFGRFDIRLARNQDLAPPLQEPFQPLPGCSPGMLVGRDGLPATRGGIVSEDWLRARPNVITLPPDGAVLRPTIPDSEYPLAVDWDGVLVDDPLHEDDIVGRVREVIHQIWLDGAEGVEREACEMLGVKEQRDWFRNPRNFWEDHIKRYSKSRRKAPVYWLLQSSKRSFGLWLYYHRLDGDMLAKALTNYVAPKVRREETRLAELRAAFQAHQPTGAAARKAEGEIERQEALISELLDFRAALERAAKLGLQPDLDDGVVLNIAPLHELVPWKAARQYWDELLAGKYQWSTISAQLRAKGLVR